MAFCNTTTNNDLPKSIRSSLLKQANQRTRIVPYHERVIAPPVSTILDAPSLGASVSSLSSGDTGAYDAPVAPKRAMAPSFVSRRPSSNRKDALQKHRRSTQLQQHQPKPTHETRYAPPAPEHQLWQAQQKQRPRPVLLSSRMQRQETRDEILCKARQTLQRQEAREDHTKSSLPAAGKIDRNEILQLLDDGEDANDDMFSLSSRDFDIRSAVEESKTDVKPLNLPTRLPTKQLDLDSCFTGSTCSTITESVGYIAPHLETRVEIARRNHRRLEAAYHRDRPTHNTSSESSRMVRPQDPPTDTWKQRSTTTRSFATIRHKNDPSSLRRSTDSRASTIKATGNRLRIMRDDALYSTKVLREDHSEHEV